VQEFFPSLGAALAGCHNDEARIGPTRGAVNTPHASTPSQGKDADRITRSRSLVICVMVQVLLSTAPARVRTGGGTLWPLHSERGAAPPSTRRLPTMSRTIPPAGAWPSPSARFSWAGGWRGGSASQAQTRRHRARASASLRRSLTACRCRRARIGSVMGVAGMGGWSGLGEAHAWVRCGSAAIARSRRGSWRPTSRTLAQVTLPHAAK
jgi:hypothetical protein